MLPRGVKDRPILYGLLIDTEALSVGVDMTKFMFEFGAGNFKMRPRRCSLRE